MFCQVIASQSSETEERQIESRWLKCSQNIPYKARVPTELILRRGTHGGMYFQLRDLLDWIMAENKKEAEIYFLEIEKIYHDQKPEGA